LIEAFYESPPELSYYEGCSTGGRQGMMAAQRFPEDFDAIIAGAPVYNQLALNASQFFNMKTLIENRALALPPEKVELLHNAVLAECEVNDGVADGFLNNPLACGFDPASLQCADRDDGTCLTADQVRSAQSIYAGTFSRGGEQIYPGHARGFELGWRVPAAGAEPSALQTDATRFLVYEDSNWDWREFDFERDLALAREKAGFIEALETDLSAFKARGGKILFYHGWNDPGPSPINTINYYESVAATLGGDQADWMRLFLMPGVGHCRGGIGPDQADFLGALEAWVEDGEAPERITATRSRNGATEMSRPLCAFPEVAVWDGEGNTNDASSFVCSE
jgi:feruloyl esterase